MMDARSPGGFPGFVPLDGVEALLVDDHPLVADAMASLLQPDCLRSAPQMARSAQQALALATASRSLRLVLLDLQLPDRPGLELIEPLLALHPAAAVVVLSGVDAPEQARAAFDAGACAFASKACDAEQLLTLLQRVLCSALAEPIWLPAPRLETAQSGASALRLNARQTEVLQLLAQGLSNKEIARQLGLAEITVKGYVSALFRALEVGNRTQAVLVARRLGLV